MALSIKDPETEALARDVARRSNRTITETVRDALAREATRIDEDKEAMVRAILAIGDRLSRYPVADTRSIDEMLYDENGLPK